MRGAAARGIVSRRALRATALAGVLLLLAGCQTPPEPDLNGTPCIEEGAVSSEVRASGELFTVPAVEFDAGLSAESTERSVLVEGSGPEIALGSLVTLDYVAYNARTGELLEQTGYGAAGLAFTQLEIDTPTTTPGLRRALLCAAEGSRIVAIIPAADAIGYPERKAGIEPDDSIVFVIDIISVARDRAHGEAVAPVEGLPTVTVLEDGQPLIDIPDGVPPPPTLQMAVIQDGPGPVVRESATVTVKYRGVLWRNGLSFDDNWRSPLRDQRPTHEFLPGFAAALVGQTVGSQVLVVIPPEEGYGKQGDQSRAITGTDTLVYVIDILATT